MAIEDLCWLTLTEASERIAARSLSPVELTEAMLARIGRLDPALHAYLTVLPESALSAARAAEADIAAGRRRGPLHGIPVAVKDLCDLRGTVTTCASRVLDDRVAGDDATCWTALTRYLRDQGDFHVWQQTRVAQPQTTHQVAHHREEALARARQEPQVPDQLGKALLRCALRRPRPCARDKVGVRPSLNRTLNYRIVPVGLAMDHGFHDNARLRCNNVTRRSGRACAATTSFRLTAHY